MGKFNPSITRIKKNNKFVYIFIKTSEPVECEESLEFIDKLRIPPVWEDVKIDIDSSDILVTGMDKGGKKQYIYSIDHVKKVAKIKFCKLIKMGSKIEKLKVDLAGYLESNSMTKDTLIALIIKTIIECSFRIGTEKCFDKYESVGMTTIQKKHLFFDKNSLKIEFIGKKGVLNTCFIFDSNPSTKNMILLYKKLIANKKENDFIFNYENKLISHLDVNRFLEIYGNITSKDFRTWNANTFFLYNITHIDAPENKKSNPQNNSLKLIDLKLEKERKKATKDVIKMVAEKLHHTEAICKKNYLLMDMVNMYIDDINKFKKLISKDNDYTTNFLNFLKWYCKGKSK